MVDGAAAACNFRNSEAASAASAGGVLRFSILNWSAWTPGRETRAAWCSWAGVDHDGEPTTPAPALPMMLRRRLSPFGQRLVGAISDCAIGLPPARYVLSTRHGELTRALTVLDAIEADGMPSPTDFSMAIHHALLGLLSIHTGNRLGHTALSAGQDSFANGLLEAASCIAERPDEPVILVHGDDKLPSSYEAFREPDDAALPVVVALALGAPGRGPGRDVALELAPAGADSGPAACMAADFLRFFLSNEPHARASGRRTQWSWRRVA
jgi:beta-ketoacyl synthase-like protein